MSPEKLGRCLDLITRINYHGGRLSAHGELMMQNVFPDSLADEKAMIAIARSVGHMRDFADDSIAMGSAMRRLVDLIEPELEGMMGACIT